MLYLLNVEKFIKSPNKKKKDEIICEPCFLYPMIWFSILRVAKKNSFVKINEWEKKRRRKGNW